MLPNRPTLHARGLFRPALALCLAVLPGVALAQGTSISIPNYSFESQLASLDTDTNNDIDDWETAPQPADFNPGQSGFTWNELTGVFGNTPVGYPDHIDNIDGNQAAYIFADPEVALFQDYNSTDWQDLPPNHAFDAVFEPGHSYTLTIGIIGGGGDMAAGASLDLSLYYRDGSGDMVNVASTSVVYSSTAFPTTTDLIDYQVTVPTVQATDPWAGQNIGIEMLSTATASNEGGYWDLDNVRLTDIPAVPEPCSAGFLVIGFGGLILVRSRRRGAAAL